MGMSSRSARLEAQVTQEIQLDAKEYSGVRARLRVPEEMHIQRRARSDPRDAHPVSAEHSDLCGLWCSRMALCIAWHRAAHLVPEFSAAELLRDTCSGIATSSIPSTESGEGESTASPCEVASLMRAAAERRWRLPRRTHEVRTAPERRRARTIVRRLLSGGVLPRS